MKKLRLLDVSHSGGDCGPGPEYLSDELSFIRWQGYPSRSLPPSFRANKLVYLHMNFSRIVQLWKGRKILDMLKVVDLSFSLYLIKTPDFSAAPNLEKLILYCCKAMKEVHPSLGNLQRLTFLDLSICSSLKRFSFGFNMTSLEFLKLTACEKLKVFPQIVGDMKRLKELHLDQTAIKEVHPSIEKLTGLVVLNLRSCRNLRSLPSTIGHLKLLNTLDLSRCPSLEELPKTLKEMEWLEKLDLQWTPIRQPHHLPFYNLKTSKLYQ
jgi:Leucine-rich repeat (LRR) protein